jgi:hypothetical protein
MESADIIAYESSDRSFVEDVFHRRERPRSSSNSSVNSKGLLKVVGRDLSSKVSKESAEGDEAAVV